MGTAEQLCSSSCDTLGHSWLGRTVSPGQHQYNAFQELDGGLLLPPCPIKHPGGQQWGRRWSCGHSLVGQSEPFQKGMSPVLGFAEVQLLTLMGWCCVTVDHRTRWYFMTASLEEFGITAEPTEKYPPCKEDIKFFKAISSPGSPGWCIYGELN